jgi:hypothetical protein
MTFPFFVKLDLIALETHNYDFPQIIFCKCAVYTLIVLRVVGFNVLSQSRNISIQTLTWGFDSRNVHDFSFFRHLQTGPGSRPILCLLLTGGCFISVKETEE